MSDTSKGAVCAAFCHDCGAELGKPSDLMRHDCPIGLARKARLAGDPSEAPPHRLYALCRGDETLYVHALREAGHIVLLATGKPEDPCSICGWSPT